MRRAVITQETSEIALLEIEARLRRLALDLSAEKADSPLRSPLIMTGG